MTGSNHNGWLTVVVATGKTSSLEPRVPALAAVCHDHARGGLGARRRAQAAAHHRPVPAQHHLEKDDGRTRTTGDRTQASAAKVHKKRLLPDELGVEPGGTKSYPRTCAHGRWQTSRNAG